MSLDGSSVESARSHWLQAAHRLGGKIARAVIIAAVIVIRLLVLRDERRNGDTSLGLGDVRRVVGHGLRAVADGRQD